ncbi:hypothetical protein QZH41_003259 [Actinostola sp. cb2023]|nr:hypothetical protein QZH41_003259 [Actinostola sp. cb2023]
MKVLLWTAPRCVSTAFERAIMTLGNTKVFHEPYSNAFYFGPERQSLRYASTPINPKETYRHVTTMLCKDYDGVDVVFSKDMVYCVENHFEIFLDEEFKDVKHTFLIRDPAKAIPSLHRASTNPKLTGWDYFDPEEAGFRQMYDLYKFVSERVDASPVVVDADDLLDNPDETMKSYCNAVGISYEPHMTTWEPGPISDWDVWSGWHEDALKSSGFTPRASKKTKRKELEELPVELRKVIEEASPHYKYLSSRKIRPAAAVEHASN